jgi:hypothetical protein
VCVWTEHLSHPSHTTNSLARFSWIFPTEKTNCNSPFFGLYARRSRGLYRANTDTEEPAGCSALCSQAPSYIISNGPPDPSPKWPGTKRSGTMRPDGCFAPGYVGYRAWLAAQARPYILFLVSGWAGGPTLTRQPVWPIKLDAVSSMSVQLPVMLPAASGCKAPHGPAAPHRRSSRWCSCYSGGWHR